MKPHICSSRVARRALLVIGAAFLIGSPASAQTYTLTDLGTLGGWRSIGVAINAGGQVTGTASADFSHAFLFTGTEMQDLGTLGGPVSEGFAINAAGQVTGYSYGPGMLEKYAFLYTNGNLLKIGTLGGPTSAGLAINDSGQVTGRADIWSGKSHAFLFGNGSIVDLGTLGGTFSVGVAINGAGQVTGSATTADEIRHAFVYSGGTMIDLGTLGGALSDALAINAAGQITGSANLPGDTQSHAFLYSNGIMTDLGTLGGTHSEGLALNAAGQVTGRSFMPGNNGEVHAFLFSNGVMTDLGALGARISEGLAINTAGQVVGRTSISGQDDDRAFLYSQGVMADLNTLIPSGSGWVLRVARAINDRGQITGWGMLNGVPRAFLLTPVTLPQAHVQQPIDADGSSVFNAKRGVVPVRFTLTMNGSPTCQLPAATIAVTRTVGSIVGPVDESVYAAAADNGSAFRTSDCQYVYNLAASSLSAGRYRVEIAIDGITVGDAEFSLR